MVEAESQLWFLRKHEDGTTFGPVAFSQLLAWAESAHLSPLDRVSTDEVTWMRTPMLAALHMDWLIDRGADGLYGPTTLGAVQEFFRNGEIEPDAIIINACAATEHRADALIELELDQLAVDGPPTEEPLRRGVTSSLQQRIRELEELLMEARRDAQMWRDRFDRLAAAHVERGV